MLLVQAATRSLSHSLPRCVLDAELAVVGARPYPAATLAIPADAVPGRAEHQGLCVDRHPCGRLHAAPRAPRSVSNATVSQLLESTYMGRRTHALFLTARPVSWLTLWWTFTAS